MPVSIGDFRFGYFFGYSAAFNRAKIGQDSHTNKKMYSGSPLQDNAFHMRHKE
jgi:hypothetical protein